MRLRLRWISRALPFIVLLAVVAGWIHSHVHRDTISFALWDRGDGASNWKVGVTNNHGVLSLRRINAHEAMPREVFNSTIGAAPAWTVEHARYNPFDYAAAFPNSQWFGWFHERGQFNRTSKKEAIDLVELRVPYWALCMAALIPSGWMLRRVLIERRRWAHPTSCQTCGYDLRAGHDRCTECGAGSHVKAASESASMPTA